MAQKRIKELEFRFQVNKLQVSKVRPIAREEAFGQVSDLPVVVFTRLNRFSYHIVDRNDRAR